MILSKWNWSFDHLLSFFDVLMYLWKSIVQKECSYRRQYFQVRLFDLRNLYTKQLFCGTFVKIWPNMVLLIWNEPVLNLYSKYWSLYRFNVDLNRSTRGFSCYVVNSTMNFKSQLYLLPLSNPIPSTTSS